MHKKFLAAAMFLTFAFAFLLGGCGGASSSSQQMVGAYTEDRDLTDDDLAVFTAAMADNADAANYMPETVATQVVSGTNYRFYAKDVAADKYVHVFIYLPLGEDAVPELTEITDA